MNKPNKEMALYQNISDYKKGMNLPSEITILYSRLSKDDKDRNGTKDKEDDSDSIVNQKKMLADFAKDNRLANPIFFTDDGISGTTFNREDFQAALELVEAGRVKNFVVKDLSRFGRSNALVGYYTEYIFPEMDVRFIAINDDVDDTTGESDITVQIKNMFNEYFPRDTSKKVKAVFQNKSKAGEPLSFHAPYGYKKDPNNSKRWIIDEPAAKVVGQIFQYCMEGLGVSHIAKRLRDEQVEIPTVYAINRGHRKSEVVLDPYDWNTSTIVKILERREYLGCIINFKTYSKSYKHRKRLKNDPSKLVVIENAHEAIISEEVFERVQQLRSNKRRPCHSGRENVLNGLVYCFDCGSKMNQSSGASMKATQDYFSCSGFTTKKRRCCSSHYIRRVVLEQMVLDTIQTVTAFVSTHEREFVEMQEVKTSSEFQKNAVIDKKNLAKSEKRVKELDILIQQLFEKNALGVISDERFMSLSKVYEQEQQTLGANVEALRKQLARQQEDSSNVGKFLEKARKYSNVAELSKPMLNELVERVEVHMRSERYSKGVQGMTLHFNYVGDVSDLFLAVISQEEEQSKPQAKRRPRPQVVKQLQEIPIMATVKS